MPMPYMAEGGLNRDEPRFPELWPTLLLLLNLFSSYAHLQQLGQT